MAARGVPAQIHPLRIAAVLGDVLYYPFDGRGRVLDLRGMRRTWHQPVTGHHHTQTFLGEAVPQRGVGSSGRGATNRRG